MGKRILLVEGQDDRHVMWNLLEVRGIRQVFEVRFPGTGKDAGQSGGVEALLESVPWRLATADLERLAIVVDANEKGPAARWQSIRDRLVNQGYEGMPESHAATGLVFELALHAQTPPSVRFGLWVMPDNKSDGMLEDFVTSLIRQGDKMLPFVDEFIESIPERQRRFSEKHRPKARIHSWLAVTEKPGRPMGQAIKADEQIDANHEYVQPFLDWVQAALVE